MKMAKDLITPDDLNVDLEAISSDGKKLLEKFRDSVPAIIFWILALFLLFCFLGVKEIWGPEDRWAEIVREMRLTGDYFHPRINGHPYFDKPLLSYWLIALVSVITGRLDETILRIPSALAGLLALWATMNLGRRLFSKQSALTAGWILLGTYGFVFWARTGEADMENLAAIILAVAWYWARRDKPGFFSYLIFYLICFVGAHTKGMATIAVPIIVVLPDMFHQKRWKTYISISHFLAIVTGLCIYLLPFLYADMTREGYKASGLWYAFKENITRYFRPFDHKEPWYVYFYHLPRLFFPWTILLVGAVWTCWDNLKRLDWPMKWLAVSTILVFLFFTLSGSRRSYYILPILPFCALMVSQYLTIEQKEHSKRTMLGIQMGVLLFVAIGQILLPAVWLLLKNKVDVFLPVELRWAVFIVGLIALAIWLYDIFYPGLMGRLLGTEAKLTGMLVVSVVIMGGYFAWQQNSLQTFRSRKYFSMELKDKVGSMSPDNIVFYRNFPPKMLFYMDMPEPVDMLKDAKALEARLNSSKEPWILISRYKYRNEVASVLPQVILDNPSLKEEVHPWERKETKYEAWIINDKISKSGLMVN